LWAGCSEQPQTELTLHAGAPIPSGRACATAFVADGEAYVFAGRDSLQQALNDLWRYSPETNSWTSMGETPLAPRVNATACTLDGKVYVGMGFNGGYQNTDSYMRDWWEYTPATDTWRRLADYPNSCTDRAVCFTAQGAIYAGYGFYEKYTRDMFRYDVAADRWDSIDVHAGMFDFPPRSFGGTGCTCRERHFMGSGYYRHSLNWWGELVDGTHWEEQTPVPGKTRTLASCTATADYIYLSGGLHYGGVNTTGDVLQDIRRYDPQTDTWLLAAILPQGIYNHCSFTIGNKVFIGPGEGPDEKIIPAIYWFEE